MLGWELLDIRPSRDESLRELRACLQSWVGHRIKFQNLLLGPLDRDISILGAMMSQALF